MDRATDRGEGHWRIGELAKRTGLSVRGLRHYDEIGLLVPFERSFSGYRLYSDRELQRLYRIVALRQLGMSLEDVAVVLAAEGQDPRPTVRRQLQALEHQRELEDRLRSRLMSILEVLDQAAEPSTELFIEAIEVTIMIEKYYTPEQLEQLRRRERDLGGDAIEQAQRDWSELIAAVKSEREQGTAPTSPRMQALARRWQGLIELFTGGDAGIRGSLQNMYENEGAESVSRGGFDDELMQYVGEAIRALPPRE
jgi:DNA-binding transcriptional MerR regulator